MTYLQHFKANLKLAAPVMLTQVAVMSVGFADTLMVGHLGAEALGAISLANAFFFAFMLFGIGFSMASSPLFAKAFGERKFSKIHLLLAHSLTINFAMGIFLAALMWAFFPLFDFFDQSPRVLALTKSYLNISILSTLGVMVFQTYKQFSEGMGYTIGITLATVVTNALNIFLNYLLIFGHWGFPELKTDGAAWATAISRFLMPMFLLIILKNKTTTREFIQIPIFNLKRKIYSKLMQLGFPIAFQMFFEVTAFTVAAFIAGSVSAEGLAAHQIVLQMASLTFLICTGFAVSATVKVGFYLGEGKIQDCRKAGNVSIISAFMFMFCCGLMFIFLRNEIPTWFIQDNIVHQIAAQLFIVAAFFQLSDGLQAVGMGALRGLQDVKIPSIIAFVAYWVIALPMGYYLAKIQQLGVVGLWIALGFGLTFSALALMFRWFKRMNFTAEMNQKKSLGLPHP